jgi:NADPH:quinone reductase-like Zn-dependent oxidoreductase
VKETPIPTATGDEVVVRVHATTVNRTDCAVLSGSPYIFRFFIGWPKPKIGATGTDFAGEVVAAGADSRFLVGERLMGFNDNNLGSHAEYVTLSGKDPVYLVPDGVLYEAAAASIEGGHYARNFINKVTLKAGDHVLVNGATGAIGSAAVALLKRMDVQVTAVCPKEHWPAVQALGADRVLDYRPTPFAQQLRGEKFDFVFDAVGKSSFGECKPFIKETRAYISSELGRRGENPFLALAAPLMRGPRVKFPLPTNVELSLGVMADLLANEGYQPLIYRRYPLENLADAFAYVASGQKVGSVLITFDR